MNPDQLAEIRACDHAKGRSKAGITMTPAESDRRNLLGLVDDQHGAIGRLEAEVDRLTRQLQEARDEHGEYRLAARAITEEHRNAIVKAETERDEARWTARYYRDALHGGDQLAELGLGLLPDWLTPLTTAPTRARQPGEAASTAGPQQQPDTQECA